MDIALKTKLKQLSWSAIKIIAGAAALYGLKYLTDNHEHYLRDNAFLVYIVIMGAGAYLVIKALKLITGNLSWFIEETIHFLGTIWKSIVHLEFRSHTTILSGNAQERRQLEERVRKRRAFIANMTDEQKKLYQIGFNECYQAGYKEGASWGNQTGFGDGYNNCYRIEALLAEIRWDHVKYND